MEEEEGISGADREELDATLRLARQQAEARSRAHAEAHQTRLLALAKEHYSGPQPATPHHATQNPHAAGPMGEAAAAGGAAYASLPTAGLPPPPAQGGGAQQAAPSLGSVRHAALQERCRQALGELVPRGVVMVQ